MNLILDTKKIRKGKPIGLPYQGSKKKISKKIVEIIKQNFGTDKTIYDVFGGGGAITAECLLQGLDIRYNDKNKWVTDCFIRVLKQDREWIKTLIVSRDEFDDIKNKQNKTTDDYLKLLINSFSNSFRAYLYSVKLADLKYRLALDIVKKENVFGGYKQTETYKKQLESLRNAMGVQELQQLERLQQLQQLQQLERLQVTNLDYKAFSEVENAIFYLDPPYENTSQDSYVEEGISSRKVNKTLYNEVRQYLLEQPVGTSVEREGFVFKLGEHKNNRNRMYVRDVNPEGLFDSQDFYEWAVHMSKKNIVLLSSYEVSDPRFEMVYEFSKARSTMGVGGVTGTNTEKLWMVKGGAR